MVDLISIDPKKLPDIEKTTTLHMASRESPYPGTTVERFPVFDKYINWEVRRFLISLGKSNDEKSFDSFNLYVNSLEKKSYRKLNSDFEIHFTSFS